MEAQIKSGHSASSMCQCYRPINIAASIEMPFKVIFFQLPDVSMQEMYILLVVTIQMQNGV
jgi:hypothetical protein